MKPHIVVTLARPAAELRFPFWRDAIDDKSGAHRPLTQGIADVLAGHGLDVITTREFAPGAGDWSEAERKAELDRVFRLVLMSNSVISPALIADLEYLPEVRAAHVGRIGAVPLPEMQSVRRPMRGSAAHEAIRLAAAHLSTSGDPAIRVAILDTGLDTAHPEFAGRLDRGQDFVDIIDGAEEFVGDYLGADSDPEDEVGHGTHVAGIAAASGVAMPVGVAPGVTIIPVRVLAAMERNGEKVGAGLIDNINAGVKFAVDAGANVINMSLGVRHDDGGLPHENVVRYALDKGVSIVAAAGNDGQRNLYYPGALPGVIAVGSAADNGAVSPFSTYGPHVSMIAPGENIYSAFPGGYGMATGTSHAAPFVAGTAALLQSLARGAGGLLSVNQLRRILKNSSDRIGREYRDRRGGNGHLNCADAIRLTQLVFS